MWAGHRLLRKIVAVVKCIIIAYQALIMKIVTFVQRGLSFLIVLEEILERYKSWISRNSWKS